MRLPPLYQTPHTVAVTMVLPGGQCSTVLRSCDGDGGGVERVMGNWEPLGRPRYERPALGDGTVARDGDIWFSLRRCDGASPIMNAPASKCIMHSRDFFVLICRLASSCFDCRLT